MGMLDTIIANCPECGTVNYFQSKSGDCEFNNYDIKKAPDNVMLDANRHTPQPCENCEKSLVIDIEKRECLLATEEQIADRKKYEEEMRKHFSELPKQPLRECGCGERCGCQDNDEVFE